MTIPFLEVAVPLCRRRRIYGISIPLLLALALSLAGCETPLPQVPPAGVPAEVPAPRIVAGDSWTYRVYDGFTHLPRDDQHHEVTSVGAGRIDVAGQVERGDGMQVYDREWNWLRRPATDLQTFEYSPAYAAYAFPLAAGKRWHAQLTARDPRDGRHFTVRIDGRVVGWERVKVPAGEFDALKIERFAYIDYWEYSLRGQSIITEYEWYAPAVKWAVKREAWASYLKYSAGITAEPGFVRVAGGGGGGGKDDGGSPRYVRDDWLIYELASFTVR